MKQGGTCPLNNKKDQKSHLKKILAKSNGGINLSTLTEKELNEYYCKHICKNILC